MGARMVASPPMYKLSLRHLPSGAALALLLAVTGPAPVPAQSTTAPAAPMTGPQVIDLLDQTINWYRTLGVQQQLAGEPSDLLILYDNRQTANQVIALAFDIARANTEILAKQPAAKDPGGASASSQSLMQLQNKFAAQAAAVQRELDSDEAQLGKAHADQRTVLLAKISELHGELDLINARLSLLATMTTFSSQSDTTGFSASALAAQIEAMAVTAPSAANAVPAASAPPSANTASSGSGASPAPASKIPTAALTGVSGTAAVRFGIWELAANVVRLSEKAATVAAIDQRTGELQTTFARIRAPLIDQLKSLSARGDALATQADTADSATLNQVRDQLNLLSGQFKETSALLIPLSKEGVLLNQYRRNMLNWHDAVRTQYRNAFKTLGVRAGALAVLLAIVFAASEVWRRAVVRYVQDTRRRFQFLLLRRIALWCLVVVIVGFAFASELGSIVTFAGLITAGLAVAMQSVLVSIVGYFFLIGKYGIRVGDRVQIGNVTGEVIDLGLVRMHLMELSSQGPLGATGRVVAYANSIVFQSSGGLFKQIPGVNFAWHETTLSLPAGADYAAVQDKLLAAVSGVVQEYQEDIARQTKTIEQATSSTAVSSSLPQVQLRILAAGVEAVVRYPAPLQRAAEIEERVSKELLRVISSCAAGASRGAAA